VDEGLREVARRLLGRGTPKILHSAPEAHEARAACARYLFIRIQGVHDQKPGRTPDMSLDAATAMKAVLAEVGSTEWEPLRMVLHTGVGASAKVEGAAAAHAREAREEAAYKLIGNHFKLLIDVCNTSKSVNADGIEYGLTQNELVRVAPSLASHVDEGLREVARRLLGYTPQGLNPEVAAIEARAACARYLDFRIQGTDEQKPGRKPDMSAAAAAAMKAVLVEVGSTAWEPLRTAMASAGVSASCTGAAAQHTRAARKEAATLVVGNHFRLLQDVCNPSRHLNIDLAPLTQTTLTRVRAAHAPHVDAGMREAIRRLVGGGKPEMLDRSPEAQEARTACARYLDTRIQDAPDQKPGRKPDMSTAAAAAFEAVLNEVAAADGGAHALGRQATGALDSGVKMRALALASELETLASHLKLGGELNPERAKQLGEQLISFSNNALGQRVVQRRPSLQVNSASTASDGRREGKSSMCALM